ncbi:uncharacterized protein KZ484_017918 [Pholidichthys leucotaenia]
MAEGEERQRNPFNISRIPTMEPNRSDFPQHDCKEEEVQACQQLWNQDRNSFLKQEEPEPPELKEEWEEQEPQQIKEEEEEFCFSQQGELLVVKVEEDAFMVPPVYEENSHSEVKPNSEQLLYHSPAVTEVKDEERSWYVDSGSTKEEEEQEPKPKKRHLTIRSHSNSDDEFVIQWENETDNPRLHDCKEALVLNVQQLYYKERNSSLDQEEQDATQVKEEELWTSPVEDKYELKQETDSFMDSSAYEENDHSDTSTESDYLPSHNPGSTNHKIQKPKENVCRSTSHSKKVNSFMSENLCNTGIRTVTGEKPFSSEICGKGYSSQYDLNHHMRIHTGEKMHCCKMCGKSFNQNHLKTHMRIHTGERPYSCETCGQTFSNSGLLKRHMRTHTEPTVFSGDPIRYNDWKISFQTLIDRKNIPAEEKTYYLQKYASGSARKVIESYFLLGTESAYNAARTVLEDWYGNPFLIIKTFRDKLKAWPKISSKGSMGLQEFADFLRSCQAAMSQIKGLEVLSDCNENQKMLAKLPDWLTSRWN